MHRSSVSTHSGMRPNNSFKPNLLRYTNNMAERACHIVGSATQVGLTQALGHRGSYVRFDGPSHVRRRPWRSG